MVFFLFTLLILVGIFVKNKIRYYDILIILFLAMITYIRTDVADFANYEMAYDAIANGVHISFLGTGWYYICKFFALFSLTYRQTKTVIMLLSAFLMRCTVDEFIDDAKSRAIVWSLYLIYPALIDCVQIRFFLASAIFIFSVRYLIRRGIKNYLIYTICIMVAYLIHSAALFYLFFLAMPFFNRFKKWTIGIISIVCIIMFVAKDKAILLASYILDAHRMQRYFTSLDPVAPIGLVAYTATLAMFIILCSAFVTEEEYLSDEKRNFVSFVAQMNIAVCIVLPLTFFDTGFFRIQRPMWILLYMVGMVYRDSKIMIVNIFGIKLNIKCTLFFASLAGCITYICIFIFSIIRDFLL